ncbi:hypothetical protein Bca52824_077731 [Brassica carinata]|uniref:Uncharacterized protein n=1 Tax=Brassica carinata TaxID=52824 RepID=A0A8X7TXW7_BRACI|nr:hypothetical protein Bca52824_077731 [Brassica carinata]
MGQRNIKPECSRRPIWGFNVLLQKKTKTSSMKAEEAQVVRRKQKGIKLANRFEAFDSGNTLWITTPVSLLLRVLAQLYK